MIRYSILPCLLLSLSLPAQIVINEVDYDQVGADNEEFIEIKNTGALALDLAGVKVQLINGSNGRPASAASCSAMRSESSRNFRKSNQVSIGRRSRSPFMPLSLRMMSRADLISEPSCWEVVRGGASFFFLLIRLLPSDIQL